MKERVVKGLLATVSAVALALLAQGAGAQETREVKNGLEVLFTALLDRPTAPVFIESPPTCKTIEGGWRVVANSPVGEVIEARMTDPSGDPDWKAEKAEARITLDAAQNRICLQGYCEGPTEFVCQIHVKASWREQR
jgi:hypothetical protein